MRIIAHLDMDAFFAAVEERDNPRYRGKPIAVGADPKGGMGRGVVSTANYAARRYGIHSALPISTAWRLSEEAAGRGEERVVFLPVDGAKYGNVSDRIMAIISRRVSVIEQTSIDEAYLDLTFTKKIKTAISLVQKIKEEIRKEEKLTASVGIGPNKLIAKIASGKHKPDGLTVVTVEVVQDFLDALPIGDIPGIGPKTEEKLHLRKIYNVKDLRKITKINLMEWFGKWGEDMYHKARGIDDGELETDREIKSVSEQETYEKDTLSAAFLIERIGRLCEKVIVRMKREGIEGYRTVSVTVRFSDFETKNRVHTLEKYVDDFNTLQKESLKLFLKFLDRRENPHMKLIRLLGVGVENFKRSGEETPKPQSVFQNRLFN